MVEMQSTRKMNPFRNATLLAGTLGFAAMLTLPADATSAKPAQPPAGVEIPLLEVTEGNQQLALASQLLDQGEHAETAEKRREAYVAAERHAKLAAEMLPKNPDAHFLHFAARGRLAQMDGLARGALQLRSLQRELDLVLELNPNHADALSSRGGMMVKLPYLLGGNVPEGIRMLKRAVELDPQSVGKRLELVEAYHIDEQEDEAQAMLTQAREVAAASGSTRKLESVKKFSHALQESCTGCAVEVLPR